MTDFASYCSLDSAPPSPPSSTRSSSRKPDGMSHFSDIAIIGLAFQFPGASSPEELWNLMMSGECASSTFPDSRLDSVKYHRPDEAMMGTIRTQKACFLERDIAAFDARFFGMTPEEASGADPQQRILLETTYRGLENAGISMEQISGQDVSVHVGCFTFDYMLANAKDPQNGPRYSATGMAASLLSNRVSTFFNLTGPSITIDTACSSSLVALDLACKSIQQGDSSMGIVGGSNLLFTPDLFLSLSNLGFLSPDGVSHSFDSRANGYGRGEGFGVLIIKSVEKAIRDGDTIRAVIRASATNQNGATSLAMPSKELQMKLINDTYRRASLDPSLTRYFEAHGTGTAVGDPLEAMAIGNTFGPGRHSSEPVIIGALKANIGHLEGAAGIAGVIKTILVLEKGVIPPIAGLKELNHQIDEEFWKLEFPRAARLWPGDGLRRASVNSFGFGGTNSHVIMDDAFHYLHARGLMAGHNTKVRVQYDTSRAQYHLADLPSSSDCAQFPVSRPRNLMLFVWSAFDEEALERTIRINLEWLTKEQRRASTIDENLFLDSLAHTLSQRRTRFPRRAFYVADSINSLVQEMYATKSVLQPRDSPEIGFVFTGQGAQWLGMGKELATFPVFKASVQDAEEFLNGLGCVWRATDLFFKEGTEPHKRASNICIHEPRFAQPLTTILQVALVELLRSLGIRPTIVVGHSSGEIAAAYAAGAISRRTAWKLSHHRGVVSSWLADSSENPLGAMMAVSLSEEAVQPYIQDILGNCQRADASLVVACINSPRNITVSGDEELIQELQIALERDFIFTKVLKVPVAYHSPHMLRVAQSYELSVGMIEPDDIALSYPAATMISSVTGKPISKSALQSGTYWIQNMVSPVRFSEAMHFIYRNSTKKAPSKKVDLSHRVNVPLTDLLEIGPHSTLQGPIREIGEGVLSLAPTTKKTNIAYQSMLVRGQPSTKTGLDVLGRLHCLGYNIDISALNDMLVCRTSGTRPESLHSLPSYPFDDSKTFWEEPRISKNMRGLSHPHNELIGLPCADWNPLEPRWRNVLKLAHLPWLTDHKIKGEILFPAAGMLSMAIEAVTWISSSQTVVGYVFRDVAVLAPLVVPADESGVEVQLRLQRTSDSFSKSSTWTGFSLFACRYDNFVEICRGEVKAVDRVTTEIGTRMYRSPSFDGLLAQSCKPGVIELTGPKIYGNLKEAGYGYGPCFQGITKVHRQGGDHAVGLVSMHRPVLPRACSSWQRATIHPCLLDVMLQLSLPLVVHGADASKEAWIPTHISKLSLSRDGFELDQGECNVEVSATTNLRGTRSCEATIQVCSFAGDSVLLRAEGVELTMVSDEQKTQHTKQMPVKRMCYDMVLKADISMIPIESLGQYMHAQCVREPVGSDSSSQLQLYLDLSAHKNPAMKILHLGGTALTATRHVLDILTMQTPNGPFCRFASYQYTNSSPSVLETISTELDGLPKVEYRPFDPQRDHEQQGFKSQSYDLVIVETDWGSSEISSAYLSSVKKLLCRHGSLVLINSKSSHECHSMGHIDNTLKPCPWKEALLRSGWLTDEVLVHRLRTTDTSSTGQLIIASTVCPKSLKSSYGTEFESVQALIIRGWNEASPDSDLTRMTMLKLKNMGVDSLELTSFQACAAAPEQIRHKVLVVVQDDDWMSLTNLAPDQFSAFHATLANASQVIWLSATSSSPFNLLGEVNPSGVVFGLARTLRREYHGLAFMTLSVDPTSEKGVLDTHLEIAFLNFFQGMTNGTYEREILQKDGLLQIPRVYECRDLDQAVHDYSAERVNRRLRFGDRDLKLRVQQLGLLDTLYFEEASARGPLGPEEVEVEVKAIGINFRDFLISLGRLDHGQMGTECAGIIRDSGPQCYLKPGDRVLVGAPDTFRSTARCCGKLAVQIPDNMSFTEAAAIPTNFATAYYALVQVARIKPGESILIHSGAGGTGQAAIQVALCHGAKVYTTVGTADKKKLLNGLYGIPFDCILNSRDLSFANDIKRLTNGKGVDVILNSLAGDALIASWECIAPYGRFLEIGKKDIYSHSRLPMFHFARNVTFAAVDLAALMVERPADVHDVLVRVLDLFQRNVLHVPSPFRIFPVADLEASFRYLQSGNNPGKVVVEVDSQSIISARVKPTSDWSFGPEETILISGGLGVQGRIIARWMISKGARHLVLLSRKGEENAALSVKQFAKDMRAQGADLFCPACDIANPSSLAAVLNHCAAHMPPIRGCVQAAMNLQDAVFDNMTHDAWNSSLMPKVVGSWNLHQQLPRDLDFFIMFSSIAGVLGPVGQSNYAAGNAFMDALARYRLSLGEKAISLNFSMMAAEDGWSLENKHLLKIFLQGSNIMEMSQEEILAVMDHYCNKDNLNDTNRAQLVLGLDLPAEVVRRGAEPSGWMSEPMFLNLHQTTVEDHGEGNAAGQENMEDMGHDVQKAESIETAAEILAKAITKRLCKVLSISSEDLDAGQPLHVYGVDSLISVEIRNWFQQMLKVDVAVFEILGGATVSTLSRGVAEKLWQCDKHEKM